MRIFITGITGFLGSNLAHYLSAGQHEVFGSTHCGANINALCGALYSTVRYRFGELIPAGMFEGCDSVVHCAHDNNPGNLKLNATATLELIEAAERAGVVQQIFVSSHSARRDAPTSYGQIKYNIEQVFLEKGLTVIRPGLIVGPGGLFENNVTNILRFPLLLLPEKGKAPVILIALDDLLESLAIILEQRLSGTFNLFCAEATEMTLFVRVICNCMGVSRLIIPIPHGWIDTVINVWEGLAGDLPTELERIRAMRLNMTEEIHQTNLHHFVTEPLRMEEMVCRACYGLDLVIK